MPNNIVNKDVKRGKGTKKQLEQDWKRADDAAKKQDGSKDRYALTNYIYQNIKDAHSEEGHHHKASAEDVDLNVDNGIEQPGTLIQPGKNGGGSGASSNMMAKVRNTMKLNAAARIKEVKASQAIQADANEFVMLTDALTEILGKPVRKPGMYEYNTDIAGRDMEVLVHDHGRAMHVTVGKDGKPKYEADVNSAETGLRAVEEGVKTYIRHEVKDARAAKTFLEKFKRKPFVINV